MSNSNTNTDFNSNSNSNSNSNNSVTEIEKKLDNKDLPTVNINISKGKEKERDFEYPIVDVIIPAKNEEKIIVDTLFRLSRQLLFRDKLARIIVGDFNPHDRLTPTRYVIEEEEYFKPLLESGQLVIHDVHKEGVAYARNSIIREASTAPIIATLDADSYYSHDNGLYVLIFKLIESLEIDSEVNNSNSLFNMNVDTRRVMVSTCGVKFHDLQPDNPMEKLLMKGCDLLSNSLKILPTGIGSATAFLREAYDAVGGYDEKLAININNTQVIDIPLTSMVGEDMVIVNKICNTFGFLSKVFMDGVLVYTSGRRHRNLLTKGFEIFNYNNSYR